MTLPLLEQRMAYEALRPYCTPDSLDSLRGPVAGTVRVGPPIDTGLRPVYDLSNHLRLWHLYNRVVRDGTAEDQKAFLDKDTLVRLWTTLNLPVRCRTEWEGRFSELAALSSP